MEENKQDLGLQVEETLTKTEAFIEDNQKGLTIGIGVLALIVVGFVSFNTLYLPKQEKAAQEAIFQAQYYFGIDSFSTALNGGAGFDGFEDIASSYGMTKAGNLANYYAGICHLNLGNYEDATDYLSGFSTDDAVLGALAIAAQGDAEAELGNTSKALSLYKKAATYSDNEFTAPYLLKKAGEAHAHFGKPGEAKKFFEKIQSDYPTSKEGRDIEKYIARVSANS